MKALFFTFFLAGIFRNEVVGVTLKTHFKVTNSRFMFKFKFNKIYSDLNIMADLGMLEENWKQHIL